MSDLPHLLVVDDDAEIRDLLARLLPRHGFRVTTARDTQEAQRLLDGGRFALMVLDLMMPGEDGLSFCRRIRAGSPLPIIILTARGDDTDRIVGLEIGADDYLPKPFNLRELVARVRAVLRRVDMLAEAASSRFSGALEFEGWRLDLATRQLTAPDGVMVSLTAGEYDLLRAFVDHPRRVLTRDQLLDLARGRTAHLFDRSIDLQVSRLRRKMEMDPKDPQLIKTVRGGGYLFSPQVVRR